MNPDHPNFKKAQNDYLAGYARMTSFGIPSPDSPKGLAWHIRNDLFDIEDLDEWEKVVMMKMGVIECREGIYNLIQ